SPKPVSLPAYPWQRERFWIDEALHRQPGADITAPAPRDDARNLLFAPRWIPTPCGKPAVDANIGAWLLFADRKGTAAALAAELEKAGHRAWLVWPADAWSSDGPRSLNVRAHEAADIERMFEEVDRQSVPLAGIVHLWSLDAPQADDLAGQEAFQVN